MDWRHGAGPGGEVRSVLEGGVGQAWLRLIIDIRGAGSAGRSSPVSVVSVAGGHPSIEGGLSVFPHLVAGH